MEFWELIHFIYGSRLLPPSTRRTVGGWSTKASKGTHGSGLWCCIRAG